MINFTIRPDGSDEFKVVATTRDLYLWEKTNHGKTVDRLLESKSMVDMYAVAYLAARRQKFWTATEREFTEQCDLIFSGEDDAVDPTQPDQ